MIRLILLSDFTESFSYNLLKGVLSTQTATNRGWCAECRFPINKPMA